MSVYPEVWGQRLPYDTSGQIDRGQYFGAALNFELAPGDIAVFAGEHLHGSEINTSDATRYVISGRITLQEPRFFSRKAYRYERSDQVEDDINRALMQVIKPVPNPVRRQLGRIRRAIFGAPRQHYYGHPETREIPPLDDTSGDFPQALQVEEDQQQFFFHASGFPNDGVKPLNRRYCVVKSGTGYYALARYCPHQHADLAAGYLEQGRLYCPWHNLAIDFRSGESACESLPNMASEPLEQDGERVFIPAGLMA
jgi:nitrite reductase/ring-hydroxylating ferredoxin subunit